MKNLVIVNKKKAFLLFSVLFVCFFTLLFRQFDLKGTKSAESDYECSSGYLKVSGSSYYCCPNKSDELISGYCFDKSKASAFYVVSGGKFCVNAYNLGGENSSLSNQMWFYTDAQISAFCQEKFGSGWYYSSGSACGQHVDGNWSGSCTCFGKPETCTKLAVKAINVKEKECKEQGGSLDSNGECIVIPNCSVSSSGKCTKCNGGYYINNGQCTLCPANHYCDGTSTTPVACKTGSVAGAGSDSIDDCKAQVSKCYQCLGNSSILVWASSMPSNGYNNCNSPWQSTNLTYDKCRSTSSSTPSSSSSGNSKPSLPSSSSSSSVQQPSSSSSVQQPSSSSSVQQPSSSSSVQQPSSSSSVQQPSSSSSVQQPSSSSSVQQPSSSSSVQQPSSSSSVQQPSSSSSVQQPSSSSSVQQPSSSSSVQQPSSSSSVQQPSSSSSVQQPSSSIDDEIINDNPPTGEITIFVVWVIAFAAIVYSVWYFKQVRDN